ncbi:MAG: SDR family NAD(P)-dependent oxidoreductase [Actinomycetia bacterium]|nr:SDR family NAD(P)-dependent oxidoreductase [Actinomycetes bacterium]MCP3910354.1 SDR family NAD(P)-dependent oxidoreductase [Actinomycetes bacterium]MCP4085377.1 SDR family NAD(P)-dependent oxidoreductase [Actinomycetes bacterium]
MGDELRFDGRVAIVTGAGGGLGRAHAHLLAARGATVVVNDLGTGDKGGHGSDTGSAQVVVDEITAAGGRALADTHSVAERSGAEALVAGALDQLGRLDILVNNAGIIRNRTFLNIGDDELDPVLDVHLRGAFYVTRPAYEHMKQVGYGRIVNTSSSSGLFGFFGQTAYAAAKMGLVGFTKTLAIEGVRYGIQVNALAPGALTRMTGDVMGAGSETAEAMELSDDELDTALGPHHVAPVVAWLAHEDCDLTGQVVSAMGGRVARAFVAVTPGIYEPALSPEAIRDRQAEILDEAGYVVPGDGPGESALLQHLKDNYASG